MSSQLQHKLLHFEVEPPKGNWEAIQEALEDQSTITAEKLRSFEATPAPRLWQHIEDELDTPEDVSYKAVPFYKRYSTALRYGSAAVVLVLVALTITLLVNNSGDTAKVARQQTTPQRTGNTVQPADQVVTIRETEDPEHQSRKRKKETVTDDDNRATSASEDNLSASKATQRATTSRYLTVASETGKTVRLSKKVYPVFDCAEHSTALERFHCQENIEALQKMASSLASPSADFASLLDMIKTLEENR